MTTVLRYLLLAGVTGGAFIVILAIMVTAVTD